MMLYMLSRKEKEQGNTREEKQIRNDMKIYKTKEKVEADIVDGVLTIKGGEQH